MRPYSHASRSSAPERINSRKKLHDEPQSQKNNRRHRQRENKNESENPRPGVQQNVSAHHARDGATRTDGWNTGMQVEQYVQQARPDPGDQIKEEIREVAKEILDIVSKDPEKKHVPGDVQEPGMEKHAGDQRQERDLEPGMPQ